MASTPSDHDTKSRLLDVAEALFATQGFESVSLRHLTQQARVNLASVHYHFGSKEGLIDAVIVRYVNPLNLQRLALLDDAEARHEGSAHVPVQEILEAFIRPIFTLFRRSELSEQLFLKLMGRCMSDRASVLPESVLPLFHEVSERFSTALQKALPALSKEIIFWRLHFAFGVFAHTLSHTETLLQVTRGRAGKPSSEELLARAIDYCTAGFQAPVSPSRAS